MNEQAHKAITPEFLRSMSYPDFVALMKQDNTPPGSAYTVDYWIEHAGISNNSVLLDLACSTGYSSRYCFSKTSSSAEGIDISEIAISTAREKAAAMGAQDKLRYQVSDACSLPFSDDTFTHILGGCNFAFIQERSKALAEVVRVLRPQGVICTSNFYYRKKPGQEIINSVYNAIGFRPDPDWTLKYWHDFFAREDLELYHEKNHELSSQPLEELKENLLRYVSAENEFTRELDETTQNAFYERYLAIREPLNDQRDYQGVTIQLWRKK